MDVGFIPKSSVALKCSPSAWQADKIQQNLKQTNTHKAPKIKIQLLQGEMVPSLQEGWNWVKREQIWEPELHLLGQEDFGALVDVHGEVEMKNSASGQV